MIIARVTVLDADTGQRVEVATADALEVLARRHDRLLALFSATVDLAQAAINHDAADAAKAMGSRAKDYLCQGCGKPIAYDGRGRPRAWCDECAPPDVRWHRAERSTHDLARCSTCGEAMERPVASGLCGFCEEERAAA